MDTEMDAQALAGSSNPRGALAPSVQVSFDFDDLANLEQHFYVTGYASGLAHGTIHGLIEGRQLGREKGFELWEEVGFYEGFGRTWRMLLASRPGQGQGGGSGEQGGSRALQSLAKLKALVDRFPRTNPTPSSDALTSTETASNQLGPEPAATQGEDTPAEDMAALLARIRAQYRTLCATLGVRPRMVVAQSGGVEIGRKLAF